MGQMTESTTQRTPAPRRTNVDEVFDHLYAQITSLRLLPGDKISEADIAAQFGLSRQPVRDAFSRLVTLDLIVSRPQRATEVKRFSHREITKSRFVRAAVEVKVLQEAARHCDAVAAARLDMCLEDQREAVAARDYDRFGALDYEFHKTLCAIAKADFAFEVISFEKSKVDRLCLLGLAKEDRMPGLLSDHEAIAKAVKEGDALAAEEACLLHLSRLDDTIATVSENNARYFDP
ncbi:GntR family transcriptional regulator [Albirhodobacter sp. R86504]|uniref:GntR family transcriptional regulator n=1 Tax=Albirhodobacter sp. R86504 TaxID=3093848 RepID=UPI0036726520